MRSFKQYLEEKVIVLGRGARYGQVVFLAGGAGSGKGFAISNFLEGTKFKVRDVDAWKSSFLKLSKIKNKYAKLRRLNLRKPKDVFKLHQFIKEKGIKDKTLDLMLGQAKEGRLPNIMFDVTLKDRGDINETIPALIQSGYDPANIHIVWVLTNYHIAVQQNKDRSRVVPDDVLLKTHEGAFCRIQFITCCFTAVSPAIAFPGCFNVIYLKSFTTTLPSLPSNGFPDLGSV